MQWNCHYRHINPSPLEEEVGAHVISYEVFVEQDDTLHEKKFRFEYLHQEKEAYTEEELEFFTSRERGIELFFMRHPDLVRSMKEGEVEFKGVDLLSYNKYYILKNKKIVKERILVFKEK